MELETVEEIIACLPEERTLFHYHKDRYALMLLAWAAGEGCRVDKLRRGSFAPLLDKPLVKQVLSRLGKGEVDGNTLASAWADHCDTFLLTVGRWGGDRHWDQTSRGRYNLVLRVNFNLAHDRAYRKLIKPGMRHPFSYCGHPVLRPGQRDYMRETLAWARMDVELDRGEALIEEIQSDWVRRVASLSASSQRADVKLLQARWGFGASAEDIRDYAEQVFAPYRPIWDEAMLSAAIGFIRDELGLKRIWYHSWEGGNRMKRIDYAQPPRSLYTRLPRRFCFRPGEEAPGFLAERRDYRRLVRKGGPVSWYRLDV